MCGFRMSPFVQFYLYITISYFLIRFSRFHRISCLPGGQTGGPVRDPWGDKMKRLTAKLVDAINKPGKYHDGDAGLYLYVQERNGRLRKSYLQRVTVHGKRVEIGLGSTKWTSPSEARAVAQANRKIARTGGDPRRKPTVVPTLEEAADAVIAIHASTWKDGGKTEERWRAILATYAFPRFGRKSVAAVTTADVLAMLVRHWATKRETMRKLRHEIGAIVRWATARLALVVALEPTDPLNRPHADRRRRGTVVRRLAFPVPVIVP